MASKPAAGDGLEPPFKRRKADNGTGGLRARSDVFLQKRAKVSAARVIPAQPADAALKDGELDLQAFVAAHEFEIRALEQSMATSRAAGTNRAFQQVPRGLRRRTASHNPKRVPRRLRARALREMAEDNTPVVEARRRKPRTTRARIRAETAKRLRVLATRKRRKKEKEQQHQQSEDPNKSAEATKVDGVVGRLPRPKIRRNEPNDAPRPPAKFRKRQIDKTWLPTHMWQAKRARLTEPRNPLWRFAIPLTPNEKIYRPTHRAQGDKGAVVWDMSYMSTIGLYGNAAGITRVLQRMGVSDASCWNDKGRKWRMGSRSWTGVLRKEDRRVCPATILWNPEPSENPDENPKKVQRQVFLRVHPSAFLNVFKELLRLTKMETPRLYIEDLRFEIGSIDLTGPASTETLLAVLASYPSKDREKHAELFRGLAGLSNPAALPAHAVLGFSAQDPRLRHPPRKADMPYDELAQMRLLDLTATWPAEEDLLPYAIFSRDARHKAACLPSQKSINRRRGAAAPGSLLKPAVVDPPIPILLLACRSGLGAQTQGSWTLLAPWKCILPIWYSMVHCPLSSGGNPRFAGLNELRQVAFERGLPWFPGDFVGTDAGAVWEAEQRRVRKRDWEKRPKSKRVEWASLDLGAGRRGELGDGWACDFEHLFGLRKEQEGETALADGNTEHAMDVDHDGDSSAVKPAAEETTKLAAEKTAETTVEKKNSNALHQLTQITKDFFKQLTSSNSLTPAPPDCIIMVRISLLARGVVTACARIYRLPSKATPMPTSPSAEVPATLPPESPASSSVLPHDLRAQWLARTSLPKRQPRGRGFTAAATKTSDLEMRRRLLARELTAPPGSVQHGLHNAAEGNGGHPLVPGAEDLVGFVTTGSFSLSEGRGAAVGSVALDRVLAGVREDAQEGRLCVVRNAGETVGWLARWEAI